MIPFVLLAAAGYLALARAPGDGAGAGGNGTGGAEGGPGRLAGAAAPGVRATRPGNGEFPDGRRRQALEAIILGAAPMAAAQASRNANSVLAQTIAGSTAPLNLPAHDFQLTDQHGRTVSLASLRGKVVLLTFLDPVCTSDCPLIAQELRTAGQLLGAGSSKVELVAIVANPIYHQVADVQAFDRQEDLNQVPNWLFLTGSLSQLEQVWEGYGIPVKILLGGAMINHPDVAFVINRRGISARI